MRSCVKCVDCWKSLEAKLVDSARKSTRYRQMHPTVYGADCIGSYVQLSGCNRYEMMPAPSFDYQQISLV